MRSFFLGSFQAGPGSRVGRGAGCQSTKIKFSNVTLLEQEMPKQKPCKAIRRDMSRNIISDGKFQKLTLLAYQSLCMLFSSGE